MVIIKTNLFKNQFRDTVFYIAKDKKQAAKDFKNRLNASIENLINSPYKYRKSFYYQDENIRDMIFGGYSIIYRINIPKDAIEILEIFNQNLPKIK